MNTHPPPDRNASDAQAGDGTSGVPRFQHKLNLFDSTCLIVGIVVGAGIYETPSTVAQAATQSWEIFAFWTLGGVISLCGAMCYAELATTYPESGGDLIYLSRAYGRGTGFIFGWLQTFIARPGDISLMALVFAHYVDVVVRPGSSGEHPVWPAIAIISLLTAINIAGLKFGKSTQNLLTIVKIVGLFIVVGCASMTPVESTGAVAERSLPRGVALILVLFTFGGWNEMVYVASEVQSPRKNISRALLLGAASVTALYLIVNAAYLRSLSLSGMATSSAIATDAIAGTLPRSGQMVVALVIAISAAGAINGLVLTGARITGAMRSYVAFQWIGHWNPRLHTPVRALLLEGVIAITVVAVAKRFENALIYTSAAVYTFYLATGFSTIVLRWKDPGAVRPFKMPLFPIPLIVFAAGCTWTIYSAVMFKPRAAVVCFAVIAVGFVAYLIQRSFEQNHD